MGVSIFFYNCEWLEVRTISEVFWVKLYCKMSYLFASFWWLRDFLLKNRKLKDKFPNTRFSISYFLVQISFLGISIVHVLSIIYTTICICSLIYIINMNRISLNQLSKCLYNDYERICSGYGPNKRNWNSLFPLKLHISRKKNSLLWRMSALHFIALSHILLDMFQIISWITHMSTFYGNFYATTVILIKKEINIVIAAWLKF